MGDRDQVIVPEGHEAFLMMFPERVRMTPFRIIGNLYFVGTREVGMHLFKTEEGLIVMDTGWPWTRELLIENIWELGFKPSDIRIILHTHGHSDHMGATNLLRALAPEAKTYISAADAEMMETRPDLLWGDERLLFKPDVLLKDGDVVKLGSTEILCKAVPGHTIGTMAFFVNEVGDDGKTYRCAMHGGVGTNTLTEKFMTEHNLPDMRKLYRESMMKMMDEHVDVTLGNHTFQNHTQQKYEYRLAHPDEKDPFIDPEEWQRFLNEWLGNLAKLEEDEAKAKENA